MTVKSRSITTAIEQVDDLPEGWRVVPVSQVIADVPNVRPEDQPHREFGYVDISSIDNVTFRVTECRRFRGSDAPSRARRPIQPGDVLFSNVRTYLRNIAIVPDGLDAQLCSTGFTVLRSNGAVDPAFLFRYMLTEQFIQAVTPQQTGTHYPATSDRVVLSESMPLPPLAEQKRIVAKVEALLARVNAARERLAKVPTLLKRFRQSVLTAACSGQLTADGRTRTAEPWTECSLGELIEDGPQNGLYKPRDTYGRGTLIVRIANFYDGVVEPWDRLARLETTKDELAAYRLHNGDILVNRVNSMAFLGKSALVANLNDPCVFESNMMRFRVDARRILPEYLIRYLNSLAGLAELRRNAKHAVNQASINQQDVATVSVPFPLVEEQQEIVRRVEALFAFADKIEARVQAATARVERITQAILAKAFRGELVPTEAELARQESRDYEPASVLLERIRAARSAIDANGREVRSHRQRRRREMS